MSGVPPIHRCSLQEEAGKTVVSVRGPRVRILPPPPIRIGSVVQEGAEASFRRKNEAALFLRSVPSECEG